MNSDDKRQGDDLRAMFGSKPAGQQQAIQRKQDAQLTRWDPGTGTGIEEIKAKLEGSAIDLKVRAGETGRLFGSVTVNDIADAINSAVGGGSDVIDKRKIVLGNPIRSLGAHEVGVKVHDEVDAQVRLNVVPA